MSNWFNRHLVDANVGYLTHLKHALILGLMSILAGIIFLIHAVFPFLFLTTGSDLVRKIQARFYK
jgi:tetrahydromethanopterin S-methyltransferase subunit B